MEEEGDLDDEEVALEIEDFYISVISVTQLLKCSINISTPFNVMVAHKKKYVKGMSTSKVLQFDQISTFLLFVSCMVYGLGFFGPMQILDFVHDVVERKSTRRHQKNFNKMYNRSTKKEYNTLRGIFESTLISLTRRRGYDKMMKGLM